MAFSRNPHTADGRQSWCKACYAAYKRDLRAIDPAAKRVGNLAADAVNRALARLRDRHREEYEELVDEERAKRGLPLSERRWKAS
jgi:hypothetical protein